MKVVLITFITPASENIRGISALPYHLLVERDSNIEFIIYSFNSNNLSDGKIAEVEMELKTTIKKVPLPKWYLWMFKLHLLFLRAFLKYPFCNYITLPPKYVEDIKEDHPDVIFVYEEEMSRIVKQFPEFQRFHVGPDSESLYYYRMMGRRFVMNNAIDYWKCALMYRKYARMERAYCTDENFTYYAVGEEDVRHLQQLNPKVKAKFLRHPHYEVLSKLKMENGKWKMEGTQKPQNEIDNIDGTRISRITRIEKDNKRRFHQPKIKVLIAGRYDLYMKQEADLLSEELRVKSEELRGAYTFTFLGKGWEKHVERMRQAGYEVEHITFAPDYIEEIVKHDIQITPIAIGTGTKGKVLDALANGLLVIGTPYAMENIAVKHGESCVVYRQPQEVIDILKEIPRNKEKYEEMAAEGQRNVLYYHDRKRIAKQLFSLFNVEQ